MSLNFKVSVLISTYNDSMYLEECLQSVLKLNYDNFEVLVMDDGSTDSTLDILENFSDIRLEFFSRENKGKATSLNELIDFATGSFFLIQDSDDTCHPERINVLLDAFKDNSDVAIVQSGYSLICNGKVIAPKGRDKTIAECKCLIKQYRIPDLDPTMMIRADIAKEFKFKSEYKIGQGLDFIFRVAELHPIISVAQPLYCYRFNMESITRKKNNDKNKFLLEVINAAKKRRGEETITLEQWSIFQGKRRNSKDNNLSGHFNESVIYLLEKGDRLSAISQSIYALKFLPYGIRFFIPLIYSLSPKVFRHIARNIFGEKKNVVF